ncbi:MAG: Npt1/Npt2 family nucleotide transporter [Candidatus Omnitrophota bacterium]|nr:Npt1/Npt2 family nucleotide transporter [Candidatus Omnitrophota bacterium]
MHRTIGFLSKRFVHVRPEEERKVFLTFLYFFLVITAYYIIKPVSRALVLGELGSRMVPYIDLICAVVMGPVVTLFARLVDRWQKSDLVTASFWAVIGVLVVFWNLLAWSVPWVAGAFAVWVAIFSVLVVTLFWLVANDLYRPREAKRLFGLIGSGGILGGVVGSSIAAVGAQIVGTRQLLLLSAGVLGLCWLVVQQLWATVPVQTFPEERPPNDRRSAGSFGAQMRRSVGMLLQSRYLLLLVTIVGLAKVISTLVTYQLNPFIESTFPGQDAKTTFSGLFFSGLNIAAFIVQFFWTSWILRHWGVGVALFVLPAGLLLGAGGLLALPVFWLAAVTALYDGSLNYSLQQTTKELLYLPIDRSIRYKVKPFIDMVVFRFGKGCAAIVGIIALDRLHLPGQALSYVTVPLLIVWLAVALRIHHEYVAIIRTMLQARVASRRPRAHGEGIAPSRAWGSGQGVERDLAEPLGSLTDGRLSERKLALVGQLVTTPAGPSPGAQELCDELAAYETHLASVGELGRELGRLTTEVSDPRVPMGTRRQAIRVLSRVVDQRTVDYLFGVVVVEEDPLLREEAVRGLVRLRVRGRRLEFPARPIRRQVAREVDHYQRIIQVTAIYRRHHPGPPAADDPVIALLRVLLEESVDQIFRLLMLLYRPEDIHLVYEQMRASETYIRTDALELLDNLVDPEMRSVLFPVLDEDRFLSMADEPPAGEQASATVHRVLHEGIWGQNRWLSVATLCAIGRLRLTAMRPEIEQASRQTIPVTTTAAKVALHLSTLRSP